MTQFTADIRVRRRAREVVMQDRSQPLQGGRRAMLQVLLLPGFLCASGFQLHAAFHVRLLANPAGPAPVGTMITFTPELSGFVPEDLWYRFRFREVDGSFRTVRDFGPAHSLVWTSIDENTYEVEISVRDRASGDAATAITAVELTSRVSAGEAAISSNLAMNEVSRDELRIASPPESAPSISHRSPAPLEVTACGCACVRRIVRQEASLRPWDLGIAIVPATIISIPPPSGCPCRGSGGASCAPRLTPSGMQSHIRFTDAE